MFSRSLAKGHNLQVWSNIDDIVGAQENVHIAGASGSHLFSAGHLQEKGKLRLAARNHRLVCAQLLALERDAKLEPSDIGLPVNQL